MRLEKSATAAALIISLLLFAGADRVRSDRSYNRALIVYGEQARSGEVHAAHELARDLEKVYGFAGQVVSARDWKPSDKDGAVFLTGTVETNSRIKELADRGGIKVSASDPGPEAFVIKSFPAEGRVVIAGCDERGALYGVYEYSKICLGIDPFEYWTGKKPAKRDRLELPEINIRKPPPAFQLRGYFDNDSDMLANWQGQKLVIEFETWKQMIDSLARLGYNYVDPFDTMGRSEFWVWPYYKNKFPGYHTDLALLNRIIDYAHEKGMMVQVSTYLGWEFLHLPREQNCLSRHHEDWMAAYRQLLENTPVGKADIFIHSPRDPWWDRPYRCNYEKALGIEPGPLHTRVINELNVMIKRRNPNAKLLCMLWSDGKKDWLAGKFKPDPSIDGVWADNGYALYPEWPKDFKGREFGIYIHAGFWKNHVVQDPYPERIQESTFEAHKRGMTADYFVNGQDFRHFILNLEACGRAAWDPAGFDGKAFYQEWTTRYFGEKAAPLVEQSLREMHHANDRAGGFARLTMDTKLMLKLIERGIPYCADRSYLDGAIKDAESAVELAKQALQMTSGPEAELLNDQILFPAAIYLANLKLHRMVAKMVQDRCDILNPAVSPGRKLKAEKEIKELKARAPAQLDELRSLLDRGSGDPKWEDWTKIENFRKYEPPPEIDELKAALRMI